MPKLLPMNRHAFTRCLFAALLFGFAGTGFSRAQETAIPADSLSRPDTAVAKGGIFRRIGRDGVNLFSAIALTYAQPLHWQKKDFLYLGGTVLLTASAVLLDEPMYRLMQDNRNRTFDRLERVGDFFGQPEHNYPFMLALWGSGVVLNNDWLRDTGLMVIASVSASGLIQTVAKEAVGRSRPVAGRGNLDFQPFGGKDFHSFPSGHTMLAVATSWILARQVGFVPLKIVFYAIPVVTGLSRVYVGAHWFSDIILGSALGIACAESVLKLYPKLKEKNRYKFSVIPVPGGAGLYGGMRF